MEFGGRLLNVTGGQATPVTMNGVAVTEPTKQKTRTAAQDFGGFIRTYYSDGSYTDERKTLAPSRPTVDGGRSQPPSGYKWTPEGTLEPVLGGPDDPTRKRALPNQIVTQVTNERRVGSQLQKTLDRTQDFINMIENGELPLSKLSGIEYGAKRALDNQLNRSGDSTEPYVRYYELQRFVDQQVNRILSLAKGPQTDADAERARRQILDNPDNQKVVLSALEDLRRIWEDEIELSNAAVEDLTSPYGGQPVAAPAVPAAPATRKKTKRRTASGIEYEVEE
jgi:hypothetical protein